MTTTTTSSRLSDIQLLLLSAAINRTDGSLLPPSEALGGELNDRIRKALAGLLRRGLAEESEAVSPDAIWRQDGNRSVGLVITAAGREAIAADVAPNVPELGPVSQSSHCPDVGSTPSSLHPRPGSKIGTVINLLSRVEGAGLDELTDATGWQPHTTRAALTGLRKKGHLLLREQAEGVTRWRITEQRP